MKRFRVFGSALAVNLLLLPVALSAQNASVPKFASQSVADEDAIFRYTSATGLLKKGAILSGLSLC